MGTLLISFHTGFNFQLSGSTIGYFALILVALSGFLGRFLYQMIPRGVAGTELQMRDIENEDRMISEKLDVIFSHSKAQREKVQEAVKRIVGSGETLTLIKMVRSFLVTPRYIRKLINELQETQKLTSSELMKLENAVERKSETRTERFVLIFFLQTLRKMAVHSPTLCLHHGIIRHLPYRLQSPRFPVEALTTTWVCKN